MKAFLYILLGLSLGTGLTLIALQERFVRERKRLLALIESQRAKALQELEELNSRWEQECRQHKEELQSCQAQLVEVDAADTIPAPRLDDHEEPEAFNAADFIRRDEHERLILEKNSELGRLAAEMRGTAELLERHRAEIGDLQGEITFLQGEVARLEEALKEAHTNKALPDDDFVMLGKPDGHLIPGSVVRALIKGRQERPDNS